MAGWNAAAGTWFLSAVAGAFAFDLAGASGRDSDRSNGKGSRMPSDTLDWQKDRKQVARAAGLITAAIIVAALYFASEVLIPITLASLLTFLLAPLVNLLRKAYLPRVPAIIVTVLIALGILIGIGTVIGSQVADLARQLPNYQTTLENKIVNLRDTTLAPLSRAVERFESRSEPKPANSQNANSAAQPSGQKPISVQIQQPFSPVQIGERVIAPILHPATTVIIMIVVTIFALLYREDIRDRAIRLFGSGDLSRTTAAMDDAGYRLSRYFIAQLSVNSAFGVVVAVGTYFIGVPHPILWGVVGAVLRFVPYIGAWIAAALPTLLAAVVDPGWSMALMTIALYAVTEFFAGQFLEPLLYGHSTGLSPLAVVVAAIFWTWLWGPIGLIISTPLTLCAVVLGRHFEQLSFIDILLGSRPVLRPSESLYQRLLAGDLDEAQQQLEELAEEHGLADYYDDVAVEALQTATADFKSGKLSHAAADELRMTFAALTEFAEELDARAEDEAEATTAPIAPGARILCLRGRGPFDSLAALMLAQLFKREGIEASTDIDDGGGRQKPGTLELNGMAVVCVLYLDSAAASTSAKLWVRRLKQRNPETKVVLGLVQKPDADAEEKLSKLGADDYVASLKEALTTVPRLLGSAAGPAKSSDRLSAELAANAEEGAEAGKAPASKAKGGSLPALS